MPDFLAEDGRRRLVGFILDAEMPLLLKPRDAPLACWEPLAEFEDVNAHFSAQVHTFFSEMRGFEDTSSAGERPHHIHPDYELQPVIRVGNQRFDIGPDCWHRTFHTRRLTVQGPDMLPLLNRVTQLRISPDRDYEYEPGLMFAVRPVSPRTPLDLATRLPHLRELDCPWLWERLPIAYESQALRMFAHVWEGPWRDFRVEFARGVRDAMPLLPPSLDKARLWFWYPRAYGDSIDQAAQMPDLVGAAPAFGETDPAAQMPDLFGGLSLLSSSSPTASKFEGVDPVSLGLRMLGSRLEELDIRALLTPDLFPFGSDSTPWTYMQHLKVEFYACAPDGRWYFSGPKGEDPYPTGYAIIPEEHYPPGRQDDEAVHNLLSDEEEEITSGDELYLLRKPDMFRIVPIANRINPLLLAFALSLHRMPSLQDAELFTWLTWLPSEQRAQEYEGSDDVPPSWGEYEFPTVLFRWGVRYDAPRGEAQGGDRKGRVTWQVGEGWRPADEVVEAFEKLVGGDRERMEWTAFEFVQDRQGDDEEFD